MTLIVTAPFSVAGAPVSGSASGVGYIMGGRSPTSNTATFKVNTYDFATESVATLANPLAADHRNGSTIGGPDFALIGCSVGGNNDVEKIVYSSGTISNIQAMSADSYGAPSIGNSTYGIFPIENFNNLPADRYSYATETRDSTTNFTITAGVGVYNSSVSFPTFALYQYATSNYAGEYSFAAETIVEWNDLVHISNLQGAVWMTDGTSVWGTSGQNGGTGGDNRVRKIHVVNKTGVDSTVLQVNTRFATGTESDTYGIVTAGITATYTGTQQIDFATDATTIGTALAVPDWQMTATSTVHHGLS